MLRTQICVIFNYTQERRESKVQLSFNLDSTIERRESEILINHFRQESVPAQKIFRKGCFTNGLIA